MIRCHCFTGASFRLGFVGCIVTSLGGCSDETHDSMALGILRQNTVSSFTSTFQQGINGYTGATDALLSENAATVNHSASTILLADGDDPGGSGKASSPVLRWDISSIPADVTVTLATIRYLVIDGSSSIYSLYPLSRTWSATGVTWNNACSATAWQTPGAQGTADRGSTAIGTVTGSTSATVTVSLNSTGISMIQNWIAHPTQNFGIIIASASNSDGLRLASGNYSTVSSRPLLTVSYTRNTNPGTSGTSTGGTGGCYHP